MSFKANSTKQSSSAAFDQRRMPFGMVRSRGCVEANVLDKGPHTPGSGTWRGKWPNWLSYYGARPSSNPQSPTPTCCPDWGTQMTDVEPKR